MDSTQEVASGLIVACRNRPVLLQLGEEVLYQMPRFVEMFVVINRFVATRLPGITGSIACALSTSLRSRAEIS